jgi:hypothetical protein
MATNTIPNTHTPPIKLWYAFYPLTAAQQMVYLYATNAIKLAISLATAELEACNISPHTATSIIHMFVPACNISVNIYLSTTPTGTPV